MGERNKTNLQFLTFNMHGRLKVKTSAEQQEQKRKERAKKLAIYRTVTDKIFTKRKNGELDDEILDLTGKVLAENPDIYTFWNVRKETLLKIKNERPDEIESYVSKELGLTEHCIKVNSKSYNSWFQRSWVLDLSQEIDFIKELALCNRCLDLDDINFQHSEFQIIFPIILLGTIAVSCYQEYIQVPIKKHKLILRNCQMNAIWSRMLSLQTQMIKVPGSISGGFFLVEMRMNHWKERPIFCLL